jgi:hypothetical protein
MALNMHNTIWSEDHSSRMSLSRVSLCHDTIFEYISQPPHHNPSCLFLSSLLQHIFSVLVYSFSPGHDKAFTHHANPYAPQSDRRSPLHTDLHRNTLTSPILHLRSHISTPTFPLCHLSTQQRHSSGCPVHSRRDFDYPSKARQP